MRTLTICAVLAVVGSCGPARGPRAVAAGPGPGHWIEHDGARVFYYDPGAPLVAYHPDDAGPYAVTLAAGTPPARMDDVVAAGAIAGPTTHLEGDSYVVRIPGGKLAAVRAVAGVTAVVPLAPERRYTADRFHGDAPVPVVIDLFDDVDQAGRAGVIELVGKWGAELTPVALHTLRGEVSPTLLPAISRISDVRWIEPR